MIKRLIFALTITALLGLIFWASDKITLQGERTIYTVNCEQGVWENLRCTGKMTAGDRYRYRASKSRREVTFWIAGSSTPSGKYTDCNVKNRDNWSCNTTPDVAPSITHEMKNERATHGPGVTTVPFRAVPKWKWWLLRAGIAPFDEADY